MAAGWLGCTVVRLSREAEGGNERRASGRSPALYLCIGFASLHRSNPSDSAASSPILLPARRPPTAAALSLEPTHPPLLECECFPNLPLRRIRHLFHPGSDGFVEPGGWVAGGSKGGAACTPGVEWARPSKERAGRRMVVEEKADGRSGRAEGAVKEGVRSVGQQDRTGPPLSPHPAMSLHMLPFPLATPDLSPD